VFYFLIGFIIKAMLLGLEQRYFLQAMRKLVAFFIFFLKR